MSSKDSVPKMSSKDSVPKISSKDSVTIARPKNVVGPDGSVSSKDSVVKMRPKNVAGSQSSASSKDSVQMLRQKIVGSVDSTSKSNNASLESSVERSVGLSSSKFCVDLNDEAIEERQVGESTVMTFETNVDENVGGNVDGKVDGSSFKEGESNSISDFDMGKNEKNENDAENQVAMPLGSR